MNKEANYNKAPRVGTIRFLVTNLIVDTIDILDILGFAVDRLSNHKADVSTWTGVRISEVLLLTFQGIASYGWILNGLHETVQSFRRELWNIPRNLYV